MNIHSPNTTLNIEEAKRELGRRIYANTALGDFYNGASFEHEVLIEGCKRFERDISWFVQIVAEHAQASGANFYNRHTEKSELPTDAGSDLFDGVRYACQNRADELREDAFEQVGSKSFRLMGGRNA